MKGSHRAQLSMCLEDVVSQTDRSDEEHEEAKGKIKETPYAFPLEYLGPCLFYFLFVLGFSVCLRNWRGLCLGRK